MLETIGNANVQVNFNLYGLPKDRQAGIRMWEESCENVSPESTTSLDETPDFDPYENLKFKAMNIYAFNYMKIKLDTALPDLVGKSLTVHNEKGAIIACGEIKFMDCNSLDLADALGHCNGLQACLVHAEDWNIPLESFHQACLPNANYLELEYECRPVQTSQPTTEPTPVGPFRIQTPAPTPQPTPNPFVEPVTAEPTAAEVEKPGFDFSGGCSGNGSFTVDLKAGAETTLGRVPKNTKGLRIDLEADGDVDITLYDVKDVSKFRLTGQALIRYCTDQQKKNGANCGLLGNALPEEADFEGSVLRYSGYDGVGGNWGKEYIEVLGTTSTDMNMGAWGYEDGAGTVTYSWSGLDTPCCNSVPNACGGEFRTTVDKGEVTQLGEIPKGKLDLRVELESSVDIDIQLYDIDNTTRFEEGEAIVAYCEGEGCNFGPLTRFEPVNGTYAGMQLAYSGWDGQRDFWGSEYLRVTGLITRTLSMGLLGYEKGSARVIYSFTEPEAQP
jgi:hypothetical protein